MISFLTEFEQIRGDEISLELLETDPGGGPILPFYYWNICVDGKPVGKISLRIGENFHSYYNGNVGYEVDEAYRGRHYAQKACRMILPAARAHGMERLIFACAESNVASYKTIQSLGAVLLEIAQVPQEYFAWREGMERQRIYSLELAGTE